MSIPEFQLDTWAKQGSVTQSKTTYATIRGALEDRSAAYADKSYDIFLQGSYGNDTNIYADSDVDVVINLTSTFYHDLSDLSADHAASFRQTYLDATYGLSEFKRDVLAHLTRKYGQAVKPGSKAIHIEGSGTRRDADILVSASYRRYLSFAGTNSQSYAEGVCFFASDGARIVNFPKQHSKNCTAKHQMTEGWFKPAVRIMKNMRNRMIDAAMIEVGLAPSYFLEGMLYNVPDANFVGSYNSTMANCINWILQCDRSKLLCANEQYYLLRNGHRETWTEDACMKFLTGACELWEQW